MDLNDLSDRIKDKVTERNLAVQKLNSWEKKRKEKIIDIEDLEVARVIFQKAAKATQDKISIQISDIVSKALAAVFDDPYRFVVKFETRRNVTECDLWFEKNGQLRSPMDSCGYGAADIASIALRVSYWKMSKNCRNFLALDEPTRNLSRDKQPRASQMLKKLSEMGIQFLIVTHNPDVAAAADKTFTVTQENGEAIISVS